MGPQLQALLGDQPNLDALEELAQQLHGLLVERYGAPTAVQVRWVALPVLLLCHGVCWGLGQGLPVCRRVVCGHECCGSTTRCG
jgi:hypothetical protein